MTSKITAGLASHSAWESLLYQHDIVGPLESLSPVQEVNIVQHISKLQFLGDFGGEFNLSYVLSASDPTKSDRTESCMGFVSHLRL